MALKNHITIRVDSGTSRAPSPTGQATQSPPQAGPIDPLELSVWASFGIRIDDLCHALLGCIANSLVMVLTMGLSCACMFAE
jgi:hypothetical protein